MGSGPHCPGFGPAAAGSRVHRPYLPQAVIAALHATAPSWEDTDWRASARLTTGCCS
ncbi:RNA polymerase sigma factor domain protein [Mycobacterium xenopi 3993]|nr:RNA polymerase sigma factor domain protein [Mycobacterium xenopi 3993]